MKGRAGLGTVILRGVSLYCFFIMCCCFRVSESRITQIKRISRIRTEKLLRASLRIVGKEFVFTFGVDTCSLSRLAGTASIYSNRYPHAQWPSRRAPSDWLGLDAESLTASNCSGEISFGNNWWFLKKTEHNCLDISVETPYTIRRSSRL
jgi:hypothetical protein